MMSRCWSEREADIKNQQLHSKQVKNPHTIVTKPHQINNRNHRGMQLYLKPNDMYHLCYKMLSKLLSSKPVSYTRHFVTPLIGLYTRKGTDTVCLDESTQRRWDDLCDFVQMKAGVCLYCRWEDGERHQVQLNTNDLSCNHPCMSNANLYLKL